MRGEEKKIIGITVAAHGLVHVYEGIIPPLIPLLLVVFNTDYFHIGIVVTLFTYAFGLGALPAGFLVDRIGPRRPILFYLFGAGLVSVLVWPVSSLFAYGAAMAAVGLFCSAYHPPANTLIHRSMTKRGSAFGIHGIAGSLGAALTPAMAAGIASLLGWKAPHVIFGLLGLSVAVFALRLPENHERREEHPQRAEPQPRRQVAFPLLAGFYLTAILMGLAYRGIITFLPTYLGQSLASGASAIDRVAIGGALATLSLLSGSAGQYLAGRLSDRHPPMRLYAGAQAISSLALFILASIQGPAMILAAVIFAFAHFFTQPLQNIIVPSFLPAKSHGMGYGILFFLTFGISSISATLCGYIADRFGLQAVILLLSGTVAASCLVSSLLLRSRIGRG